ncbi:MAG: flagellar hook-basal body complex protein [Candidimonas sp.]|nr:MAG: flagellar hook-basal body complex protein [Candidimonas sp.]
MSFQQGLSGLDASAQDLDVIGNNISNSGTVGFKSSTLQFSDVYANAKVGMGVAVAATSQDFSSGTVTASGNEYDMAIDGQNGMFRLLDPEGNVFYSRAGQFHKDQNNHIVNAAGQVLTGYIGGANSTAVVPLVVPVGNIAPQATANVSLTANLDANAQSISITGQPEVLGSVTLTPTATGVPDAPIYYRVDSSGSYSWVDSSGSPVSAPADGTYTSGAGTYATIAAGQVISGSLDTGLPNNAYTAALPAEPFSAGNTDSYTSSLPVSVYDSLGNSHQLMIYFAKRSGSAGATSNWDAYYQLDGKPVDLPAGGGPVAMTFDGSGRLTSTTQVSLNVAQPGGANSPAAPLALTLNMTGSTQYGGAFSSNFNADGYATGEFTGVAISKDGSILANYTNGESQMVGTVALASFNNLQGLIPAGDNAWQASTSSGQALLGRPGTNGLANIKGQAVEDSNVDLSQELVSMIIAQRSYQANAQSIKTQDQVVQTLLQMN